jgi:hypothetical protein
MNLKRRSLYDRVVALRNSVLILPVFFVILSVSCTKESSILGLGFVPAGDKIQTFYTDTITVYSSLLRFDSVTSYAIGNALYGSYKDPVFGVATANVITQISPYVQKFRYGTNPVADSVVLQIRYESIYGNRSSTAHFTVYELTGLFNSNESSHHWDTIPYYSNFDITPYLGTQIGEISFNPNNNPKDSLLRFHLNANYFGNKIIQTDTITNDSLPLFHHNMEGICIIPDKATTDGYLFKSNLGSSLGLTIYYHNSTLTDHDSSSYFWVYASDNDARINTFTHDYSSSKFQASLIKPTIHDTLAYIQSMSGVVTKLSFPGIYALKTKSTDIIAINKAELIFPVDADDTTHYPPSGMLELLHLNYDGSYVTTPDYQFFNTDSAYLGSNYEKYNRRYVANLNKHLEYSIAFPSYKSELYVIPTTSIYYPFPGRTILKNGTGANKIRLKVTYTKR